MTIQYLYAGYEGAGGAHGSAVASNGACVTATIDSSISVWLCFQHRASTPDTFLDPSEKE